jgi:hypothetical protein
MNNACQSTPEKTTKSGHIAHFCLLSFFIGDRLACKQSR